MTARCAGAACSGPLIFDSKIRRTGGPAMEALGKFIALIFGFSLIQSACRWLYLRWRYPGSSPEWEWPTRWPLP
jgi:hypothetical protein